MTFSLTLINLSYIYSVVFVMFCYLISTKKMSSSWIKFHPNSPLSWHSRMIILFQLFFRITIERFHCVWKKSSMKSFNVKILDMNIKFCGIDLMVQKYECAHLKMSCYEFVRFCMISILEFLFLTFNFCVQMRDNNFK